MSRRHPPRVLALWALAALFLLAAAALFGYGRFGGTPARAGQPYEWDGQAPLVIAHQGGVGAARDSWCDVRPQSGEHRRLEGRSRSLAEVRVRQEEPWFTGRATVTCTRASILTGPFAPHVSRWFLGVILALGTVAVGHGSLRRHRGTAGDSPAGPGEGDPPSIPATDPAVPEQRPDAVIALTASGLARSGPLWLRRPTIVIDGREQVGSWGQNRVPVRPGRHMVEVYVPRLLPRKGGPAELTVSVAPGQTLELEYCVPLWGFLPGSLGPPPQPHRGAGITVLVLAAGLVLACVAAFGLAS